jgi:uncharacterized protein (TIGR01777 family)
VAGGASPVPTGLTVAVAGGSGLIGQALHKALVQAGHSVHRFVRRAPADPHEHAFDPTVGTVDQGIIDHADVVVNLSGASIGKIPWTKKHKHLILSSRIQSTTTLAQAIAQSDSPPKVFVSASAVGVYGSSGDTELNEDSPAGDDFLAGVTVAWEEAAQAASSATRVVYPRTGLVVGSGGAMAPLKLQTSLFVGGKTGPGTQWWPWISLHDEVRAIMHLIHNNKTSGAYNLVGPTPARSVEVTKTLAQLMRRPHLIGLPTFAIKILMGEAGEHLLLTSQKISSQKLQDTGFVFDDVTIEDALGRMLGHEATAAQ